MSETYHPFVPIQLDPAPAIAGIGLPVGNQFPLSAEDGIIFSHNSCKDHSKSVEFLWIIHQICRITEIFLFADKSDTAQANVLCGVSADSSVDRAEN